MNPVVLLFVILLGLLVVLIILKLLPQVLPLIQARLAVALPYIAGWTRSAFMWAESFVTDEEKLSPTRTVAQVAGALLVVAVGVVFALCDFQFTWATLCPIFGGECNKREIFAGFDQLLGLSTVLLAVVFGLVTTDLVGWTFTTQFARIERGRSGIFCIALLCLVMTVIVGVALATYRLLALTQGENDMPVEETAPWFQNLNAIILLTLAALLFIGVIFAFMSYETFFSAIVALFIALVGLGLGVVWIILRLVDLVAEVALEGVKTIPMAIKPVTELLQGGLHNTSAVVAKVGAGITKGGGTLWRGFRDLVRPADSGRPGVPAKANGLNSPEGSSRNLEALVTAKPQAEEPEQRSDPNGRDLST